MNSIEASELQVYNTLSRSKEIFQAINPPHVGLYVCGPTLYNDVHLGNCRTFISFDIIYRYLQHLGYQVRYVRNITDVGHLMGDLDEGSASKIEERARLECLEPMEVVQKYSNRFHEIMQKLNISPPSIEPTATGHLVEQIEAIKQIIEQGYAYVANGSVYFNVYKCIEDQKKGKLPGSYGKLSGKILEDLLQESRTDLKNQSEKAHPEDFAIWVKAEKGHLMHWPSPWSDGFPGWHLECSVMSTKYLGKTFDIHGGGMDLQFPHHENEIAQNLGICGQMLAKYWFHGNMLLLNDKKMSKSDGNYIMPEALFSGKNDILLKAYSPMVLRFFMLQAHYRSTLNIKEEALSAAEEGYKRLMEAYSKIMDLEYPEGTTFQANPENQNGFRLEDWVSNEIQAVWSAMNDDFHTPRAISHLFNLV